MQEREAGSEWAYCYSLQVRDFASRSPMAKAVDSEREYFHSSVLKIVDEETVGHQNLLMVFVAELDRQPTA